MKNNMQNLKQIISLALFLLLIISLIFNILFIFNKISRALMQGGFFAFLGVLFIISLLGLILKSIRREDTVQINIATPVKEIGKIYKWTLIIWVITYFIVIIGG